MAPDDALTEHPPKPQNKTKSAGGWWSGGGRGEEWRARPVKWKCPWIMACGGPGPCRIDLSVSPSPRTQTSQWQSRISCTGSGTRTSLGFSAIEKHWKIRSSHRFYGVYASKIIKRCAWGTCNTDSRYPERIGNIIYFITFPESKQNRAKCPQIFNPNTNEDKNVHSLVVIHSLSYNFICSSRTYLVFQQGISG